MARPPFDLQGFMKAFDPNALNKIFDPESMMVMLQQPNLMMADMPEMFEANKGRIEAMVEANKLSAQNYKDMQEKQMQIFRDVISDAADQAKVGTARHSGQRDTLAQAKVTPTRSYRGVCWLRHR